MNSSPRGGAQRFPDGRPVRQGDKGYRRIGGKGPPQTEKHEHPRCKAAVFGVRRGRGAPRRVQDGIAGEHHRQIAQVRYGSVAVTVGARCPAGGSMAGRGAAVFPP
jgi:hypothetical protein